MSKYSKYVKGGSLNPFWVREQCEKKYNNDYYYEESKPIKSSKKQTMCTIVNNTNLNIQGGENITININNYYYCNDDGVNSYDGFSGSLSKEDYDYINYLIEEEIEEYSI